MERIATGRIYADWQEKNTSIEPDTSKDKG